MAKEKEPRSPRPKNAIAQEKTAKNAPILSATAASQTARIEALPKKRPLKIAQAKTAKSKSTPTAATPTLSDLQEAIRLRAYEIYLQRAGQPGNPHEDWAVAEREIRLYLDQNTDAQA